MLIDIHAHLDFPEFEKDLDEVIKRAKEKNLTHIITTGVNKERNRKTLEIAKKYDIVLPALGIYPTEKTTKMNKEEIEKELKFIKKQDIVALGDVGLDYYEIKELPEKEKNKQIKNQKELFYEIISLSKNKNLPLIIHSRKAESDVIDILESESAKKVVMHCFSGNKKLIKKVYDNGWSFSIPPIIKFSSHFQMIADMIPISNLLTETDAPFLSPIRNKRNEPAYVGYTIQEISKIKKMEEKEVINNIFMNFQKIFLK